MVVWGADSLGEISAVIFTLHAAVDDAADAPIGCLIELRGFTAAGAVNPVFNLAVPYKSSGLAGPGL